MFLFPETTDFWTDYSLHASARVTFAEEPRQEPYASCMIVGDNIFVMLLIEKFFKTFTTKELCDARKSTEALVCLSCDSHSQVDELVAKALSGRMHVTP